MSCALPALFRVSSPPQRDGSSRPSSHSSSLPVSLSPFATAQRSTNGGGGGGGRERAGRKEERNHRIRVRPSNRWKTSPNARHARVMRGRDFLKKSANVSFPEFLNLIPRFISDIIIENKSRHPFIDIHDLLLYADPVFYDGDELVDGGGQAGALVDVSPPQTRQLAPKSIPVSQSYSKSNHIIN